MKNTLSRQDFLRMLSGSVVGAATLSLAAACGKPSSSGSGSSEKIMLQLSNDKVTWKKWFASEGKAAASAIGVGWKPNEYSDTSTYQAAIKTAGNTPKVPDLFSWWSGWLMKELVDAGVIANVAEVWNKNGSAYDPSVRKAFTFGGKPYGVPLYLSYWVTFYNKHVFKKYKLDVPQTWSEFEDIMRKLRAAGVTPFGATVDGRWPGFVVFQDLLVHSDPALYKRLMEGKAKYTDPGVLEVMDLWGRLIKEGMYFDPSSMTIGTGTSNFTTYFKQGKVAMLQWGTWLEPQLAAAGIKPGKDLGAFITPKIKPNVPNAVIFETGPLCVGAHGQHLEDAMKAIDWFASKEGQQKWIEITGFTSPRSDVNSPSPVDHELETTIRNGNYELVNRYWEATPHDIVEVAVDQFDKFMLHPNNPKAILETIQHQADQTWSQIRQGSTG